MPVRNIFIIALTAVISLACYSAASKNRYANLFAEALDVVDKQALKDIPRRELFNNAVQGMMKNMDEHSMYITDEMFRVFNEDMKQEFGGVGFYVDNNPATKRLTVLAPIPGSPAFEAGVQAGDVIAEIDGRNTDGLQRSEAIELMRGPTGEAVKLVVERNERRMPMELERAVISVPSVQGDFRNPDGSWNYFLQSNPKIGYIRLLQFGSKSVDEIQVALAHVEKSQDALVLDLRNNTGGLLDGAVAICDMFLEGGKTIVRTRGREAKLLQEEVSTDKTAFNIDKPLVILVNRMSASASEIVAGCLQDHKRAFIVGEQSWGKGTVQHVISIERGKSALKLTTARYWRPSGKYIDRSDDEAKKTGVWGVQPNDGCKIEMTEEMLFENARQRNIRDLQGLVRAAGGEIDVPTDAPKQVEELKDKDAKPSDSSETNDDSAADQPATLKMPHVDQPLQKAIEIIESAMVKKAAA